MGYPKALLLLPLLRLAVGWTSGCENTGCSGDACCPSGHYWVSAEDCDFFSWINGNKIQTCNECATCSPGSYLLFCGGGSAGNCLSCGSGFAKGGTNQLGYCPACQAGRYSRGGAAECSLCPGGQYQPYAGMGYCYSCDAGTRSSDLEGSRGCSDCLAGSFAARGDALCTDCAVGRYMGSSRSSDCLDCDPGFYADQAGATQCLSCSAGSYALSGAPSCSLCSPGSYNQQSRSTDCTGCAEGYYAPASGATTCLACDSGTFSVGQGASSCRACEKGYYIPSTAQTSCLPCDPGYHGPTQGLSSCIICSAGSFSLAAAESCTSCPPGSFNPYAGQSACEPCPGGFYGIASSGATSFESCSACPLGTASPAPGAVGAASCVDCPAGRFTGNFSTEVCFECPEGRYSTVVGATTEAECVLCPLGTFSNSSGGSSLGDCEACAPGSFNSALGASECELCEAGRFSNATGAVASATCEACSPGRFSDEPGASGDAQCLSCPPGTWNENSAVTACTLCLPGRWSGSTGQASDVCRSCPPGTASALPGGSALDSCLACVPGRWSAASGADACGFCQAGTWSGTSGASEDVCQNCSAGRFSEALGANSSESCMPCGAGVWSFAGSARCANCSLGRWSALLEATGPGSCSECGLGRFNAQEGAETEDACEPCPVKTFANTSGSSGCYDCLAGESAQEGSSGCSPCGAGFYSGLSSCEQCPTARYSVSAQASCSQCEAGYVVNELRTGCVPCAQGQYSDSQGAEECSDCGQGKYGIKAGGTSESDACQDCPAGKVGQGFGYSSEANCQACGFGTFSGTAGLSSCELCPNGRYQADLGESVCEQCEAGRYSQEQGANSSDACRACPAGSASDPGAQICSPCPVGTNAPNPGQASCGACASANRSGSIGCCPSNGADWPVQSMLIMPPGKSRTGVYVLSSCEEEVNPEDPALSQRLLSLGDRFSGNPLSLATVRPAGLHSCVDLHCGDNNTCSYFEPEAASFRPGASLQVYAQIWALTDPLEGQLQSYICPAAVSVGFAGFGCQRGALLSFGLAHLCVVFTTLFIAILFELFLKRRVDVFLEVALDVTPAGGEISQLPAVADLHRDVVHALELKPNELPVTRFSAWQSGQEPSKVQLEFQVAAIAGAEESVRQSWKAKANANTLCGRPEDQVRHAEALYKQVQCLEWKAEEAWKGELTVARQPLAVVKEAGRLPGADLADSLEAAMYKALDLCCVCCRRRLVLDEETVALRLRVARAMLQTLMTRQGAFMLATQALATVTGVLVLPSAAWVNMTCETGYPQQYHIFWAVWLVLTGLVCDSVLFLQARKFCSHGDVKDYLLNFRVALLLRFGFAFVSITDLYQDATFPVIAYRCGFDLWFVSVCLVFLGVFLMQVCVQLILIYQCWRKHANARTPEERERYHVEALFLALRAVDNHVLVYAVRPAVEERLGGASCWKMKTVESRIAFSRFIFEDAEQCALQGVFLLYFESASLTDKIWIGLSTATSLSLSFTLAVQTFAEVRDWVWHRILAMLTLGGHWAVRWVVLMILIILYRLVSAFPWFGSCAPAEEQEEFLTRFITPWQFAVPSHVVQEILITSGLCVLLGAITTLVIMFLFRHELSIVRKDFGQRRKYDFQERLEPSGRLKLEGDEDLWLGPLRALHGKDGAADAALRSVDEHAYQLVHGTFRDGHKSQVLKELTTELHTTLTAVPGLPPEQVKALGEALQSSAARAVCRSDALALLADPSFRKKSLAVKASLIQEATGAKFRLLPAENGLTQLPKCEDGPESPLLDCQEALAKAEGAKAKLVLVYVSHTGEDNQSKGKMRGLQDFGTWFQDRAAKQGMTLHLYFWIDYSCLSEAEADTALPAIPLFISACTEILVWRTPNFDRRVWPLCERLLAYCFCKGGLSPYAVDASAFASLDSEENPEAVDADDQRIAEIWAGSTGRSRAPGAASRKVAPAPRLQMLRRPRRLLDPLEESILETSSLHRRVEELVAMARSVSALEIFADRQPVDFGLTAVVELWLGPNQVLHSNQDTVAKTAWSITGPGSWLSAKQLDTKAAAEKATYAWRLQVELRDGVTDANPAGMEGDHIIPVVLPREEKVGASPAEIDLLFQEVEEVFRAKKLGKELDMDQLASAASHLGAALVSDLTSALDLDDATAIQASLKRMRGSVVPRSAEARRRLCELQLLAAVASGDANELAMATREAARVGGEDAAQFEGYSAAKQKMSTLQAKRLQQQALEVIRGETKDLESLMAVISVALGRSDWDREWDQIWTEVLEEGRAKVKQMLEVAKAPGDGLPVRDHKLIARIAVLGRKHNLSVVTRFAVTSWEESVAAAVAAQHFATLAAMARDSSGSPEFDIVLEATQKEMQRIAKLWDREGKDEARKLLGQAVQAFQLPEAAQLKASAEQCSQDASAREAQILAEVEKQLSARGESLEETWVRQVVQGLATCRAWRWPEVQEDARETMAKQVEQHLDAMLIEKTMKPDEGSQKLVMVLDVAKELEAAEVVGSIMESKLRTRVERLRDAKGEPIEWLKLGRLCGRLGYTQLRQVAMEGLTQSLEQLKVDSEEALLRAFQEEAQQLGEAEAASAATSSLAEISERRRLREQELRESLEEQKKAPFGDVDLEVLISCLVKSELDGMEDIAQQAKEMCQQRLAEASAAARDGDRDQALLGLRYILRQMHAAQRSKCSFEANLQEALRELQKEAVSSRDGKWLLRLYAWSSDLPEVRNFAAKELQSLEEKWRLNPCDTEAAPKEVAGMAEESKALAGLLSGLSLDFIEDLRQRDELWRSLREKPDAVKISEAFVFLKAKALGDAMEAELKSMLESAWEEAKQSGDRGQLDAVSKMEAGDMAKAMREEAKELLKLMSSLETHLANKDWPGICGISAISHQKSYAALAKQTRQHLRDRVDELTTSSDRRGIESSLLELYTAARKENLSDFAELLVQKLGSSLPSEWAAVKGSSLSVQKEKVEDATVIQRMQDMVDETFKGWGRIKKTRDRRNPLGTRLKVMEVWHVENSENYLRYSVRREKIKQELVSSPASGTELDDACPIRTKGVSLKGLKFHPDEPVDIGINEVWLWHGTSKAGAEGITDTDFKLSMAGSAAGTMFGRGLYFAESCMKSDEYTKQDERQWSPLILCRVTCGRLFYCDWKLPSDHTTELEDSCLKQEFHCVLGDREKVRGTFREFIVFDNDQVYPEYIVWYEREF